MRNVPGRILTRIATRFVQTLFASATNSTKDLDLFAKFSCNAIHFQAILLEICSSRAQHPIFDHGLEVASQSMVNILSSDKLASNTLRGVNPSFMWNPFVCNLCEISKAQMNQPYQSLPKLRTAHSLAEFFF